MNRLKQKMIQRALKKHKKIFPCSNKNDLLECFTEHRGQVLFWYNTEDLSTHVLTNRLPAVANR